jgi:hypothetical protein
MYNNRMAVLCVSVTLDVSKITTGVLKIEQLRSSVDFILGHRVRQSLYTWTGAIM